MWYTVLAQQDSSILKTVCNFNQGCQSNSRTGGVKFGEGHLHLLWHKHIAEGYAWGAKPGCTSTLEGQKPYFLM